MEEKLPHILQEILNALPGLRYQMALVVLFILVIVADLLKNAFVRKILPVVVGIGLIISLSLIDIQDNTLLTDLAGVGFYEPYLNYLFGGLVILLLVFDQVLMKRIRVGEYYSILLATLIGLSFILMSRSFLMLYLAIETVSICSYILTAFKFNKRSSEGALKYILFGAFSSALMLYGISLLYGLTGSLEFQEVFTHKVLTFNVLAQVGLFLTLGGIFFKLSAVPFHIWTPDVYESAPIPVAVFFSIAPKGAVLYILLTWKSYLETNESFIALICLVAIASIFYGNLSALRQSSLKRMLAYSSIAHAGFLLITALASPTSHFYFYLTIYLFMNLVAFGLAAWLESVEGDDRMARFSGVGLQIPLVGVIATIAMISLGGLPITAGFNAKLLIFIDLWNAYSLSSSNWLLLLFALGLVNIVISLFYYLRVPYFMFFGKEMPISFTLTHAQKVFLVLLSFPLLLFFFKPDWLLALIDWLNKS
ncbi:MAG: NADH-quinone oxidoreductase subunit N [Flammeovirgaceae bacterium]